MNPAQPVHPVHRSLAAWRRVVPVAIILLGVTVGVPLFLRAPLWCDLTLYDLAAKNLHAGGVHYRDVFDTNTPGFVWLLAGIRGLVGWSSEALRATDLILFTGTTLTLCRLAKLGGAAVENRLWLAAGCAGFYPFTHEMAHAQRDVWLALPALLAVALRLGRITRSVRGEPCPVGGRVEQHTRPPTGHGSPANRIFFPALVEGTLWAVAVWIKPHFLLVAGCVWLLTAVRLAGERGWRGVLADLAGNLLAGSILGGAGVWYLVASGTWAAFAEVMGEWNVGYLDNTLSGMELRLAVFTWFPPWNFLAPLTAVLALLGILDARLWSRRFRPAERGGLLHPIAFRGVWWKGGTDGQRYARGVLGAVYLLWVAQGIVLQRSLLYVHVIEVVLGLAVWASFRWNAAALVFAWLLLVQVGWVVAPDTLGRWCEAGPATRETLTPHPVFDRRRLALWPECFLELHGAERFRLQDALQFEEQKLHPHAAGITWAELNEVAEYLRTRNVNDRELVCWHDSPHALYLLLDIRPGLRFMHVNTARMIDDECDRRVCEEFRANAVKRFVVIDLRRFAFQEKTDAEEEAYNEPGASETDLLPPVAGWLRGGPWKIRDEPTLPFDPTRTVFRSGSGRGRYVVIELN